MRTRMTAMKGKSRGYTLIEMLVVMLILSVLMSVAVGLYIGTVYDSQRRACRANMRTIAGGEQAYKIKSATHTYTTVLSDLNLDLGSTPLCPTIGGPYTVYISDGTQLAGNGQPVGVGGLIIECGDASHGRFGPGVDAE